jgi:hypothetical protein
MLRRAMKTVEVRRGTLATRWKKVEPEKRVKACKLRSPSRR